MTKQGANVMKGLIQKAVAVLCCAGATAGAGGCYTYRDLVDPCYPERYEYAARKEVNAAFAPQVQNGHVLDQTVWNYHFEAGTDRLTAGGLDHLAYLARRRPHPDPIVFLQTAQDVGYDPANPDKLVAARRELDDKRVQAVKNFLTAQTAGRAVDFQVLVHDPADVSQSAVPVNTAVLSSYGGARGVLPSGAAGVGGGAGAAPPGGGR
jgi:hypothetical protein